MKKDKECTVYNKEKEFKERCGELLEQIHLLCYDMNIPFYFTAAVKNDANGTVYVRDVVSPHPKDIVLYDDQIRKHILVAAGFDIELRPDYGSAPAEE